MRKVVLGILALCMCVSMAACDSTGDEELMALRNIQALNGESELVSVNMSVTDKEAAIYAQVSARTLLDLAKLTEIPESDRATIVSYMDSVDAQLCGTLKAEDGVIDTAYTDYLLMEFQQTPYYWQRQSMNIRGMDAESRSIVVDVTYHTVDFEKAVKPESTIVLGSPSYEAQLKVRQERWIGIMQKTYGYGNYDPADVQKERSDFERAYGTLASILREQRNDSLTQTVYDTGNQITYTGLVDADYERTGATMTVRYVLVPKYTYGINQGYTCQHMYRLNYEVDKDITEGLSLYDETKSVGIADDIYNLLYRYYKCLDEDNYTGLYSLTSNFGGLDKHFEDYFETTYRKYDNFTLSIFNVSGTTVECGTTVSRKVRAKGSNMSMPIYTDRYYYVIELAGEELKIKQEMLLSSMLEGEPAIDTHSLDTTGFSSSVNLTNADRKDIENLIANFSAQQLLGDIQSDTFASLVDMSLSQSQLDSLKETMLSVSGDMKVTWLLNYLQGTSGNYASVKCRELVQAASGAIQELAVEYDFIYKGNKWCIYNYQILQRVNLDTTDLPMKGSLCVVQPGSVDSLNSMVVSSTGGDGEEESNSGSAINDITDYGEYTPNIKDSVPDETEAVPDETTDTTDGTDAFDNFDNWFDEPVEETTLDDAVAGAMPIDDVVG